MSILSVTAAQRFDSRGNPTVQVTIETEKGEFRALVPSGASKGDYEAVELRDGSPGYDGKGVLKAVKNVNQLLGPALITSRLSCDQQTEIDQLLCGLDGTKNKSNLGANAILGCSMAVARAGAAEKGIPLYRHLSELAQRTQGESFVIPVPFFNVLNGGAHSGNEMAFQEFMLAPIGATSFEEAMRIGTECYHRLKQIISKKFGSIACGIGDEGGFAPPITRPEEALELLTQAVKEAGHEKKVAFGIDPASQEFFVKDGRYDLGIKSKGERNNVLSPSQLSKVYRDLISKYPIILLEDPFAQDDWNSWTMFLKDASVEVVGDDLLATNIERIKIALEKKACNSLLLKINQIGTISEALESAQLALTNGWNVFVSHRSGETTDDFIADLTVGLGCGHFKSGAPCRGERIAKYNRMLDIEDELRTKCRYGNDFQASLLSRGE